MKYFKWLLVAMSLFLCFLPADVSAVEVGVPPAGQLKTDSPVLITGYGFKGPKLYYVQLFNSSAEVVAIKDFVVEYTISGQAAPIEIGKLSGNIKPGGYVVVGEKTGTPMADFSYEVTIPDGVTGSVNGIKITPAEIILKRRLL